MSEIVQPEVEHAAECRAHDTDDMTACDCVAGFLSLLQRRPESREDVDRIVTAFYQLEGNIVGGTLHVVLDDYNWERHHVEFCRDYAREKSDVAGERFAEVLLTLTDEQLRDWLGHPDEQAVVT